MLPSVSLHWPSDCYCQSGHSCLLNVTITHVTPDSWILISVMSHSPHMLSFAPTSHLNCPLKVEIKSSPVWLWDFTEDLYSTTLYRVTRHPEEPAQQPPSCCISPPSVGHPPQRTTGHHTDAHQPGIWCCLRCGEELPECTWENRQPHTPYTLMYTHKGGLSAPPHTLLRQATLVLMVCRGSVIMYMGIHTPTHRVMHIHTHVEFVSTSTSIRDRWCWF